MTLPPSRVLIVATGGQGEPRAALERAIAEGSHVLKVHKGDLVVFSSRQIPGNEIAIGKIMNTLAGQGVELITDRQAHPRLRPSGASRTGRDVSLDPARDRGAGAWRGPSHAGTGALRFIAQGVPKAVNQ
jgi:hypothetical protein